MSSDEGGRAWQVVRPAGLWRIGPADASRAMGCAASLGTALAAGGRLVLRAHPGGRTDSARGCERAKQLMSSPR